MKVRHLSSLPSVPLNYRLDKPTAICSRVEEQKQGHSSPLHRRFLWFKPHPVRISLPTARLATDFF